MSNYKLEFTLKQHTPIIHFQAKQLGATLRGSELKPKLDRYLIEQLQLTHRTENREVPKDEYLSWFIGKGVNHLALDYKLKIDDESLLYNKDKGRGEVAYRIYMGNISGDSIFMKMDNDYKKTIEFKSFHSELLNKINELFPGFMMQTNFGRAQSKGFGSYTVLGSKEMTIPRNTYRFKVQINQNIALNYKIDKLYNSIYYFYKLLKSGINEYDKTGTPVFYGKSLLWKYAKEVLDATWDKKLIKQHYFNDDFKAHLRKHPKSDILSFSSQSRREYLLRDLLGYTNSADWSGVAVNKSHKVEDKDKKIDRFQSPLRFKPILTDEGYDVYLWGENIPSRMLGSEFKFDVPSSQKKDLVLTTPSEFNIDAYLQFIQTIDISDHIDKKFESQDRESIYQVLVNVFNSLEKVDDND